MSSPAPDLLPMRTACGPARCSSAGASSSPCLPGWPSPREGALAHRVAASAQACLERAVVPVLLRRGRVLPRRLLLVGRSSRLPPLDPAEEPGGRRLGRARPSRGAGRRRVRVEAGLLRGPARAGGLIARRLLGILSLLGIGIGRLIRRRRAARGGIPGRRGSGGRIARRRTCGCRVSARRGGIPSGRWGVPAGSRGSTRRGCLIAGSRRSGGGRAPLVARRRKPSTPMLGRGQARPEPPDRHQDHDRCHCCSNPHRPLRFSRRRSAVVRQELARHRAAHGCVSLWSWRSHPCCRRCSELSTIGSPPTPTWDRSLIGPR